MKKIHLLLGLAFCAWSCQQPDKSAENTSSADSARTLAAPAPASATPAESAPSAAAQSGTFVFVESEPDEAQKLVLPDENSREQPVYYGSESTGEGIYFFAEPVFDMEIDAAGNISFSVEERKLYAEPVTNIHQRPAADAGFARVPLRFKGRFVKDGIELTCQSDDQSCWADKMLMKRQ